MDSDEIRAILSRSNVGIFDLIETAIRFASSDYADELRHRRDNLVAALYTPSPETCRSCNATVHHDDVVEHHYQNRDDVVKINSSIYDDDYKKGNNNDGNTKMIRDSVEDFVSKSPLTPEFDNGDGEEDMDPFDNLFDDEQTTILSIKEQLEDPDQSEDSVVELLQNLADMDITFQALKETDIGRHVNHLRKHSSNEVRGLVKHLVRKWKETVDDWVKVNQPQANSNLIVDEDSPQRNISKNQQNGHHQVPDFGYSPNPRNGSSSAERNYAANEAKLKSPQIEHRKQVPSRTPQSVPKPTSAPPNRAPRESAVDDERLNSARRRLQENYQEAQNAKKQRTIQVMDIHEIPKPKSGFFAKNKGGFHGKHRR